MRREETGCDGNVDEVETNEIIETGGIQRSPGQDDHVPVRISCSRKLDFQFIGQSDGTIAIEWTRNSCFGMNFAERSNKMRVLLAANFDDQDDEQREEQKFRSHRRDQIFTRLIFEMYQLKFVVFLIFCFLVIIFVI